MPGFTGGVVRIAPGDHIDGLQRGFVTGFDNDIACGGTDHAAGVALRDLRAFTGFLCGL